MRQIGNAMNGNDDFFGGSINPAPIPTAGPTPEANVYAPPGSPVAPARAASTPAVPVILIAVAALFAVAGLLGYRMLFSNTQIEIPQTLMGLERADDDSPLVQQLDRSVEEFSSQWPGEHIEAGLFQSGDQILFVIGGEVGSQDLDGGAEGFFAGMDSELAQSGSQATFRLEDPGPRGGDLRCLDLPNGTMCGWIDDDVVGLYVMAPNLGEPAQVAQEIREAIEQ
jgi:hypothetical protein